MEREIIWHYLKNNKLIINITLGYSQVFFDCIGKYKKFKTKNN